MKTKEQKRCKYERRGLKKKKSGGGPPDLSGAGSREWVSSLKDPSRTRKNAPSPVRYMILMVYVYILCSIGEELGLRYARNMYLQESVEGGNGSGSSYERDTLNLPKTQGDGRIGRLEIDVISWFATQEGRATN